MTSSVFFFLSSDLEVRCDGRISPYVRELAVLSEDQVLQDHMLDQGVEEQVAEAQQGADDGAKDEACNSITSSEHAT